MSDIPAQPNAGVGFNIDPAKFCQKPDRDVPKLICGYPLPCPYHTVTIEADSVGDLERALANLRWLSGRVSISTHFLIAPCSIKKGEERPVGGSVVRIVTRCTWARDRSGVGSAVTGHHTQEYVAELPLHATPAEIRNTAEEQQIEARAWLEQHFASPSFPVVLNEVEKEATKSLLAARSDGIAERKRESGRRPYVSDGIFYCACGASHGRGSTVSGGAYRCLQCGELTPIKAMTSR